MFIHETSVVSTLSAPPLKDEKTRMELLTKAIDSEAEVDALIIRIGCEFGSLPEIDKDYLKTLLRHLRQSVQLWRDLQRRTAGSFWQA